MYKGLLLKESLDNVEVLSLVKVVNVEVKKVPNTVEGQPSSWTFVYFEINDGIVDSISKMMSRSLRDKWYLNINGQNDLYVVFPNKVFYYVKGDDKTRDEAIKYGLSIGIPKDQLDWDED